MFGEESCILRVEDEVPVASHDFSMFELCVCQKGKCLLSRVDGVVINVSIDDGVRKTFLRAYLDCVDVALLNDGMSDVGIPCYGVLNEDEGTCRGARARVVKRCKVGVAFVDSVVLVSVEVCFLKQDDVMCAREACYGCDGG